MKFSAINFPCPGCGASQIYSPYTGRLTCDFCGNETEIPPVTQPLLSNDYLTALASPPTKAEENSSLDKEVACKKCGASFTLSPKLFASHCPYCNTPAMIECLQKITPQALLPFVISQKKAQDHFKEWVGSRWFAPNAFKAYLDESKKLIGCYFPYWTYDTQTVSHYEGKRGDTYYVTVSKSVVVNGKEEFRDVEESRIRWTEVSGIVDVAFDDLTIAASHTIDHTRLDTIEPWPTAQLTHFDLHYISGFEAEEYAIEIDEGFDLAKQKMNPAIKSQIRADIGGDQQQIDSTHTQYNNIGYKSVLFPVWIASFVWNNKTYEYAINAQTGKIVGERPYSIMKIVFAVATTILIIGGAIYYNHIKG